MILRDETTPMPAAEFSFQQYIYGTGGCESQGFYGICAEAG